MYLFWIFEYLRQIYPKNSAVLGFMFYFLFEFIWHLAKFSLLNNLIKFYNCIFMETFNSLVYWIFGHYLGRDEYNSTYFTVINKHGPIYDIIPTVLNIISFFLTILSTYLIATKLPKEKFSYKLSVILSHIVLFLSCFTWGSLMNVECFFPAFAFTCRGHLKFIGCQHLWALWILFYSLFALSVLLSLLIRMRVTVRRNGPFDFSILQYSSLYIFFILFVPVSDICQWYFCAYTGKDAYSLLLTTYPTIVDYLDFHYTVALNFNSTLFTFAALFTIQLGFCLVLYLAICFIIIYEIKKQSLSISVYKAKYHLAALREGFIQSVVIFIFMILAPYTIALLVFCKPEWDTRIFSLISNSVFTSCPIPNIITMIALKRRFYMTVFREFLRSKLPQKKKASVIVTVKSFQI